MIAMPPIPVPQCLYFVDGGKLQTTCCSRASAEETADYWRHMFRINVKVYVYRKD